MTSSEGTQVHCPSCGRLNPRFANQCSGCGIAMGPQPPPSSQDTGQPVTSHRYQPREQARFTITKSVGIAVALAIVPAFIGFYGIGHFYLKQTTRGLVILFGYWVMIALMLYLFYLGIQLRPIFAFQDASLSSGFILLAAIVGLGSWALFFWQIYDAARLAKTWNTHVKQTGRRPW